MKDDRGDIDQKLQKGQQFASYRIIEVLDQGRFADSYLVQSSPNSTARVLEILQPPLVSDLKESFLTQAQALMQLEHPHILRIRERGVEQHHPFLVTDDIPHVTLRKIYAPGSKQTLAAILPYLKQVAAALQYAHDHKILHRDVRPENIFLTRENSILLRGFVIDAITENQKRLNVQRADVMRKSVAYAAPELLQGKAVPASDQYSLGIVVYELLCGELPFTGSYIEIANQQINTPVPSIHQRTPAGSSRIERIVMTALAKNPEQRFTRIEAFINALEREYNERMKVTTGRRTPPPPLPVPPRAVETPVQSQPQPQATPPRAAEVPTPPSVQPAAFVAAPAVQHYAPVPAPQPVAAQRTDFAPAQPLQVTAHDYQSVTPPMEDSPLARRRDSNTVSRRIFAVGLVGLAAVGGAGGWYVLSKRLIGTQPAPPPISPHETPPATTTVVNNKNVLVFGGHLASVNALAWSPDGTLIASASDDKFVQVWDAKSGARKLIYSGHSAEVVTVAWSPNGKLLASGSQDGTVQVWDATSGKKLLTFQGHKDRVNGVSWSSDSQQIASGSDDKSVQVWDATTGTVNFTFAGHTAGVLCVGWQPDNSSVASGSWDGTLRDWATIQHGDHFNAGDQIFNYGGHGKGEVYALAWSPDGNFIASAGADQTVQLSNGSDGTPRPGFFTGHQRKGHVNQVRAVSWSPDNTFIVSGDNDGNVYVWKIAGRKTAFTYQGHKKAVNAVAWSPNGNLIASASADTTVQVWQPE